MAKKKVFVSFDFDNDMILKEFIIGQAKLADSPFEVTDVSLQEAAPRLARQSPCRNHKGRRVPCHARSKDKHRSRRTQRSRHRQRA